MREPEAYFKSYLNRVKHYSIGIHQARNFFGLEERYGANMPPAEKGRFFDVSRFRNKKLREGTWLMWSELLKRLVANGKDSKEIDFEKNVTFERQNQPKFRS